MIPGRDELFGASAAIAYVGSGPEQTRGEVAGAGSNLEPKGCAPVHLGEACSCSFPSVRVKQNEFSLEVLDRRVANRG
jgi:hypothetical protein